ncbi:collagen alpha-1(I) chain-like [Pezoporus flaviventris]|uniref:collagen alpha-1(I) chain-like n=1 Tax=Pezoporus flaviventris TaxID=889875 RepID=UPI002AB2EA41|nr:collagen alpha-1(I) chain-like [Pezoporus flaviventris]
MGPRAPRSSPGGGAAPWSVARAGQQRERGPPYRAAGPTARPWSAGGPGPAFPSFSCLPSFPSLPHRAALRPPALRGPSGALSGAVLPSFSGPAAAAARRACHVGRWRCCCGLSSSTCPGERSVTRPWGCSGGWCHSRPRGGRAAPQVLAARRRGEAGAELPRIPPTSR